MVANLQDQPLCLADTVNLHRRSRRAIPAGVVKQIDQTLHNSITISEDLDQPGIKCLLGDHHNPRLFRWLDQCDGLLNQINNA